MTGKHERSTRGSFGSWDTNEQDLITDGDATSDLPLWRCQREAAP
jgi:hypothetical protein